MKWSYIAIVFLMGSSFLYGQENLFWGDLTGGNYSVGYKDTIVFNNKQRYTFENYNGDKPFFISIWYPTTTTASNEADMLFEDYFHFRDFEKISHIRDSLIRMQKTSLREYGLESRIDSWDFENEFHQGLYNAILKTNVKSSTNGPLPQERHPVVVYHHGMGSFNSDNAVLFEYLASHGFVVLSSNFHWPNQGNAQMDELQEDINFVMEFTYSLPFIDRSDISYIGHSWGAQIGLVLNQQNKHYIKRFYLLDSTLEQLPLRLVKNFYPELDSIMSNYKNDFATLTFVITSQKSHLEEGIYSVQKLPEFEAYKLLNLENFKFYIAREPLNHEGFTSTAFLRYPYISSYPQSDSVALKAQFQNYLKLNEQLLAMLKADNFTLTEFFYLNNIKD